MNGLINDYVAVGRFEDSLKLLQEMLTMRQKTLGRDDPETLGATANVAVGYFQLGRLEEALKLREEVLPLMKAKIPEHAYTLITMSNLANSYAVAGRHKDALKLYEEVLELRKAKHGPDDPETLLSMRELAECLINCDRGAEAVPLIDECVRRAAGKALDANFVPALFDLRLRHFETQKDASGCRTTAEMWERLNRTDAESLHSAACFRAVTAAVLDATEESEEATAEADLAMNWLTKAVAAGYGDAAHMKQDKDLDSLRDREDFTKLLVELESKPK
jgi:tetratricopeptide (TPR) repeat protein